MSFLSGKIYTKIIAITIAISMLFQGIVGASPDTQLTNTNTLQAPTVFTRTGPQDAFSSLLTGYIVFFLKEIEADPRNQNVTRIQHIIDSAVQDLKDTENIPDELKNNIPEKIEVYEKDEAIMIDLGTYKIRYFNHNIPGSEIPDIEEPGFTYEVIHQTQVGRYLSRQILKQKELPAPEEECPHGPALFIDPETDEVRALRDEPDEPGGLSEHQALNEALDDLVFKQGRKPLQRRDPLYDFINLSQDEVSIYVIEDDALGEELTRRGFSYIAEGLITHAGTFRHPETRQARALNLFVPKSVYTVLNEFLKISPRIMAEEGSLEDIESMTSEERVLILWRMHEISHLTGREQDIDSLLGVEIIGDEITRMARMIHLFSKARRAYERRDLDEAGEYIDEGQEMDYGCLYAYELMAEINEARRDWEKVRGAYFGAVNEINIRSGRMTMGGPFGRKCLEMLDKTADIERYLTGMKMQGDILMGSRESPMPVSQVRHHFFHAVVDNLVYLNEIVFEALQRQSPVSELAMEGIEILLYFAERDEISNQSGIRTVPDNILTSQVFYNAGQAYYLAGDYDKTVECFKKSVQHDEGLERAYAALALTYFIRDSSEVSFDRAFEVLEDAEQRLGTSELLTESLEALLEAQTKIESARERANEEFRNGDYSACRRIIEELDREIGKASLPGDLSDLQSKNSELVDLKSQGKSYFANGQFDEATGCFDEILEKNPADEESKRLKEEAVQKKKDEESESDRKVGVKKVIDKATPLFTTAKNQQVSGRISRARSNYNKALEILKASGIEDESITKMIGEIEKRLTAIAGLSDRVERVREEPEESGKRKKTPRKKIEKEKKEKKPKRAKRKTYLSPEAVKEFTATGTELSTGNNRRSVLKAIGRIADRTMKNVDRVEGTRTLMRARSGNFRIFYRDTDSGDVLILSVVRKGDGIYSAAKAQFPDSLDYGPMLEGAITLEDFRKRNGDFGPALFIDPETDEIRALNDEPDEPGGISEHQAVNEACEELVFKQEKEPLRRGDPLYDFINLSQDEVSIYVIEDDALGEELTHRGFSHIAEGLITHAGTFRHPETRETRAFNLFVPKSVYTVLNGFLKISPRVIAEEGSLEDIEGVTSEERLLALWRAHEAAHFIGREQDIDSLLGIGLIGSEITRMAKMIHLFSRAEREYEKRNFEEAYEYFSEAQEMDHHCLYAYEMMIRLNEARRNWVEAQSGYFCALNEMNIRAGRIVSGRPYGRKYLEMLDKGMGRDFYFGGIKRYGEILIGGEESPVPISEVRHYFFFGLIDNVIYLSEIVHQALQGRSEVSNLEKEIIGILLYFAERDELENTSEMETVPDNVLTSQVFYIAGQAYYFSGDHDKAVECFEKSLQHDGNNIDSTLSLVRCQEDCSRESFRKARQGLEQAEEISGPSGILTKTLKMLRETEEKVIAASEKAREQCQKGDYSGCSRTLKSLEGGIGKIPLSKELLALRKNSQELGSLKKRGESYFDSRQFDEAIGCFDKILEKNPADEETKRLKEEAVQKKQDEEAISDRKDEVKKVIDQATPIFTTAKNQQVSGRISRARSNYNKALKILKEADVEDESITKMIKEIKKRLAEIANLPDRVERVRKEPEESGKRKRSSQEEPEKKKKKKEKKPKKAKRKAYLSPEVVAELTATGTELSMGNNPRMVLNAISRIANRTMKTIEKVEGTRTLMRARTGNFRIFYRQTDSGDVLILSVVRKGDGIYSAATARFPDSLDCEPILEQSVTLEDFQKKARGHGPALFIDPRTDEVRALRDEPDGISEHQAVNEAIDEIVFKQGKEPLEKGDPIHDFVNLSTAAISIYVYDDEAFETELDQKGFGYVAEGLLTHAGTYRDPDSNLTRASNLFIPESVYKVLLGLLKRATTDSADDTVVRVWRIHETAHFLNRMADIDARLDHQREGTAGYIFLLAKAERAFEKGRLDEALEHVYKAMEMVHGACFTYELMAQIAEAQGNLVIAQTGCILALNVINIQAGMITIGHPLGDKLMEIVQRGVGNAVILKGVKREGEFLEKMDPGDLGYDEMEAAFKKGLVQNITSVSEIVTRKFEERRPLSRLEMDAVEVLLRAAERREIVNTAMSAVPDEALESHVYFLGGEAYFLTEDYDKAIECFERSIEYEKTHPAGHARLAIAYAYKDRSRGSFEKAHQVIEQAEERFGTVDILSETSEYLTHAEDEIKQSAEKAHKYFEKGDYGNCRRTLTALQKKFGKTPLPDDLLALQSRSEELGSLRSHGRAYMNSGRFDEAIKCFDEILEKNPSDKATKKLKEEAAQLKKDGESEKDRRAIVDKILKSAQEFLTRANNQVVSGKIGRARGNYNKALEILRATEISDEAITKMIDDVEKKLAAIEHLPDTVKREVEEKKRGKRRRTVVLEEEPIAVKMEETKRIVAREIFFSKRVINTLTKGNLATEEYHNRVLESMRRVSTKDMRNVDIDKITDRRYLWRIRTGDIRIVFAYIGQAVLVLSVFKRKKTYKRVFRKFTDSFDYGLILDDAIAMTDFEKQISGEGVTMKAPGSLPMDEDERVDEEYITGLVSRATERTGDVNIQEAAAYINKHAPPLGGAEVTADKIKIYTIDSLGDMMGIPRLEGAEKAIDLIYEYGVYDEKDGMLNIYVTRQYFKTQLKDNTIGLAEFIDHEYTEKVLGYSHRVAASRSCKFIPEGGVGLSPFHYFYADQIIDEKNYELAKFLTAERFASKDVLAVYRGDKSEIRQIEAYETLFFDYLRLLEWLKKAEEEEKHDVLAELSLRIYKILEKHPGIKLTEGQEEIYKNIEQERFYVHEFKTSRQVYMSLSQVPLEAFAGEDEDMVFMGNKLGSRGELYCKGQETPLITFGNYPRSKIAFKMKNGDIYRIWILDNENSVIDFRQMGQIHETDEKFRMRFNLKIERTRFNALGDCIVRDQRLDVVGNLHIGGRAVNFGSYYSMCKVEIKVKSGQIEGVVIFDERGSPVRKVDFVLIYDKKGRLLDSFHHNLPQSKLEKLDGVTLKKFRLNSNGALILGASKDPIPHFHDHPNAEVEIDIIQGHIDKVRILGEDGRAIEEHIFKLVYDEENKVICSFCEMIYSQDFDKTTGRIKRWKTDKGGLLRAGNRTLGSFPVKKESPVEAVVERGITKEVQFFKDEEAKQADGDPIKYSLVYDPRGKLMDSFNRGYSEEKTRKLKRATVKEFYLRDRGVLFWGDRYWAGFTKYPKHKVEFDVVDGIVTEVRIFDKKGERIIETVLLTLIYEVSRKGTEKLFDSYWKRYASVKFQKLKGKYVIRRANLTANKELNIGGKTGSGRNIPRARFPEMQLGAEVVVYVEDAKITGAEEVLLGVERILQNAREVIPRLVHSMMKISERISAKDKDEKIVLLLDMDLTDRDEKKIGKEIERLIRLLTDVENNNGDLKTFLANLEIRRAKGKDLLNKKGNVKDENVIVVTSKSNLTYFKSIEDKAVIAAIDDENFPESAYFPLLEVVLFAIGKYMEWDEDTLREHYGNIPNAAPIEDVDSKLFKRDMRNVVIKLIPDATEFNTRELVDMMERIRDILSKA